MRKATFRVGVLSRSNLHTIKSTHCKCTVQWLSTNIHPQKHDRGNFQKPPNTPLPFSWSSFSLHPGQWQPLTFLFQYRFACSRVSHKWAGFVSRSFYSAWCSGDSCREHVAAHIGNSQYVPNINVHSRVYQSLSSIVENWQCWGSWVAQSVKRPTSAQVMISWSVSSSPALGSVLTAESQDPVSDSVSPPLSDPPCSCSLSVSKINKR